MNSEQLYALTLRGTDLEGTIKRFCGDEQLYLTCLVEFLDDPTMDELNATVANQQWDAAVTAAHALKGVAGNMGFIPLMHVIGKLVVLIRGGKIAEVNEMMEQVNNCYNDIRGAIRDNFLPKDNSEKENLNENRSRR